MEVPDDVHQGAQALGAAVGGTGVGMEVVDDVHKRARTLHVTFDGAAGEMEVLDLTIEDDEDEDGDDLLFYDFEHDPEADALVAMAYQQEYDPAGAILTLQVGYPAYLKTGRKWSQGGVKEFQIFHYTEGEGGVYFSFKCLGAHIKCGLKEKVEYIIHGGYVNSDQVDFHMGGGVELHFTGRLFQFGYIWFNDRGVKYLAPQVSLTPPEVLNLINIVRGPLLVIFPTIFGTRCSLSHDMEKNKREVYDFCNHIITIN